MTLQVVNKTVINLQYYLNNKHMSRLSKILIGIFIMSIIIFIPSLGTDNCNETNSNPFSFIMQFFCNIARYCRKISIFLFLVSILGFVGVFYFNRRNNY